MASPEELIELAKLNPPPNKIKIPWNFFEPTFIQHKIISFVGDNKKSNEPNNAMLESVKLILNEELINFFDNQRKMVR